MEWPMVPSEHKFQEAQKKKQQQQPTQMKLLHEHEHKNRLYGNVMAIELERWKRRQMNKKNFWLD